MRKGKVQGQSQTILWFVESGYEKATTKRMCGIFSTEGEKAKEKFRKLEAVNLVCSTGDNEVFLTNHRYTDSRILSLHPHP